MAARRRPIRVRQTIRDTDTAGNVYQIVNVGSEDELDAAAKCLAEKVRSDLEAQVGLLQLSRPVPIAVRWSSTGRPVQGPASVVAGVRRLDGDVTQLSGLMREKLPRRQLVVLGPPGAGKSVAALLLACDLVRQLDPREPVPVLLPISSWRPNIDLNSWIARHVLALCPALKNDYGRDVAERMVRQARVMPVLDGLDELPRSLHARAVEAIDKAVADGVPLLVTCRNSEYERVVAQSCQHLTRAAVVELEPIEAATAIGFLQASRTEGDTRWDPVFKRLRRKPGSPLGRALSSPLMLYLAREAYRPGAKDPQELLDPVRFGSQAAVEGHLLETFLPTVYAVPAGIRHKPGSAERWLLFMARRLHGDRTVSFGWMQVRSVLPAVLSVLLFGGVLGWFTYLISGSTAAEAVMSISIPLIFTLVVIRFIFMQDPDQVHDHLRSALRRRRLADSLVSFIIGCAVLLGVTYWLRVTVGASSGVAWRYGITVGAGLGGAILLGTDWGIYKASHVWFWLTGRLPWRLTAFLDEARRLGVLRLVGPAYQFRHLRLLEQLSGPAGKLRPQKEPESGETARRRRWWGLFLGSLLPATLVLAFSLLMAFIATDVRGDTLAYRSGDKPVMYTHDCFVEPDPDGGASETCMDTHPLTWELRAGSTMHTVLGPPTYQYSVASGTKHSIINAIGGELSTNGCTQASLQVAITVSGLRLKPFVMGLENMPVEALAAFPREPDGEPLVEIMLHRIDTRPCTLRFTWTNPWLSYDQYGNIKKRL